MPALFSDVVLPDGSVAAMFTVAATLWTALVMLWRHDQRRSNATIRDLQRRLDRCQDELYRRNTGREPPPLPPPEPGDSGLNLPRVPGDRFTL